MIWKMMEKKQITYKKCEKRQKIPIKKCKKKKWNMIIKVNKSKLKAHTQNISCKYF